MIKTLLIFIFLSGIYTPIHAEEFSLGNGVVVSDEQLKEIEQKLPKTTEEKTFFHWTKRRVGLRWITQKSIDPGEVSFYNIPTGDKQVYGPGIYLASSPTSSSSYGDIPVTMKVKKGTPIYDENIIKSVLGKNLTAQQASRLGEKIPLIRSINEDWYLTNHPTNTSEIGYGLSSSTAARIKVLDAVEDKWDIFSLADDLSDAARSDPEGIRLKKLIMLSDYMDGMSFVRALKVNPENPWNEFEPHQFDNYQHSLLTLRNENLNLVSNRKWDTTTAKKTLSAIWASVSGKSKEESFENNLRLEGIRAGGDREGKMFFASEKELNILKENPFIEVVAKKHQPEGYLVEYFYPDAFHFKKLKGLISDQLYTTLLDANPDHLMANTELRQQLNKQIISELTEGVFKKYHGIGIGLRDEKSISFMRDLISIHPFSDNNGRTIRMYFKLAFEKVGANVPYFMISDMDLLLSPKEQMIYLSQAILPYREMQKSFIEEFALAKGQNRIPNYLKSLDFDRFISGAINEIASIDLNDPATLELIKKREWAILIDKATEQGWDNIEKNLNDPIKRSEVLKKLYAFDSNQITGYTKKIKEKVLRIFYEELKSPQDISDKTVVLFKKYESMYAVENPTALSSPQIIKQDLVKKVCGSLSCTTVIDDNKFGSTISLLRQLDSDDITLLEYYLSNYSKEKGLSDIPKIYLSSIVNGYKDNHAKLNDLAPEKKIKFIKLLDKGMSLLWEKQNKEAVELMTYLSTSVHSLPEGLEKTSILNHIKEKLALFEKNAAESLDRALALTIHSNIEKDEKAILKMLSQGSLIDKDRTVSNRAWGIFSNISQKYITQPTLFSSKSIEDQKEILLFYKKNMEAFFNSDSFSNHWDSLNFYKSIYAKAMPEVQKTLPSPEELLNTTKNYLQKMYTEVPLQKKEEILYLIRAHLKRDGELLAFFTSLPVAELDPVVGTKAGNLYDDILLKMKSNSVLFKKLPPEEQVDILNSLKIITEKSLNGKLPQLYKSGINNYKDFFELSSELAQEKMTSPSELLNKTREAFLKLNSGSDWTVREAFIKTLPSIIDNDAEILSQFSKYFAESEDSINLIKLYSSVISKYQTTPSLIKNYTPHEQKIFLQAIKQLLEKALEKQKMELHFNYLRDYENIYQASSVQMDSAQLNPQVLFEKTKKELYRMAIDQKPEVRQNALKYFSRLSNDSSEILEFLSLGFFDDKEESIKALALGELELLSKERKLIKGYPLKNQEMILSHLVKLMDKNLESKNIKAHSTSFALYKELYQNASVDVSKKYPLPSAMFDKNKKIFHQFALDPKWSVRRDSLQEFARMSENEEDLITFLSKGFLSDKDKDIRDKAEDLFSTIMSKYHRDPSLFDKRPVGIQEKMRDALRSIEESRSAKNLTPGIYQKTILKLIQGMGQCSNLFTKIAPL